jgi:RHH-type rel operon transcriptional repressor/antitoxin RelB
MANVTVTFRTERATVEKLDELAKAAKRDRTQLISDALDNYLEAQEWQLAEIQAALKDSEAGDYATDAEVEAIFNLAAR